MISAPIRSLSSGGQSRLRSPRKELATLYMGKTVPPGQMGGYGRHGAGVAAWNFLKTEIVDRLVDVCEPRFDPRGEQGFGWVGDSWPDAIQTGSGRPLITP